MDRLAALEGLKKNVQAVTLHTTQIGGVTADVQRALSYKARVVSNTANVPRQDLSICQPLKQDNFSFNQKTNEGGDKNGHAKALNSVKAVVVSSKAENSAMVGNAVGNGMLPSGGKGISAGADEQIMDGIKKKPSFFEAEQGPITAGMVSQAINTLPEGFWFQDGRKLRVMGNKKEGVRKVKGAPQVKADMEDAEVEKFVKDIGSIESFRKAYNLEKMKTKQYTFQVLVGDAQKFLDPDMWPEGVCCRY